MATTRDDLSRWFDEGVRQKAEFMLVAVDTFDWEDYPVYVEREADFDGKLLSYQNPDRMSKVMEVYDLKQPKEPQITQHRTWNTPSVRRAMEMVRS